MSDPVTPDAPDLATLPPSLRLLKWLVIALTLTMIAAVITVVALLVTRMPQSFAGQGPALPSGLYLPAGTDPVAVTFGTGWTAIVTDDDRILIFGQDGRLWKEVPVMPAETP